MSYIGNTPTLQAFAPAVDYFNGNASTTSFTLSRPVASVAQVQAFIENVPQNPSSAFSVSGNTITFTSAPPSGTNNIYVEYTSPITQVNALTQNPSIIGDVNASKGLYAAGTFNSAYTDGAVLDYTTGTGRITVGASDGFKIRNGGPSSPTDLVSVDSSGNVGIGTSSPAAKLHVAGSSATDFNALTLRNGDGTTGSAAVLGFEASSGTLGDVASLAGQIKGIRTGSGTSGALAFWTNNAGTPTERMRIDSSGNVGIGTSSPNSKLSVSGSVSTTPYGKLIASYFDTSNATVWTNYQSNTSGYGVLIGVTGDNLLFGKATGSGPTEFARIDTSGNLLVGTTTANAFFGTTSGTQMSNDYFGGSRSGAPCAYFNRYTSTGSLVTLRYAGTEVGHIDVTGSATTYATSSDYRLKENVQPMTGALSKVAALKPVTYTWKADGSDGQGFIAHELQAVVPDCVTGKKDAVDADGNPIYQGIDTSFLVATLTAAIQEQQAIIQQLTARIETLEAK